MSEIRNIKNQEELDLALSVSEGYMVTVTLKEKGELNHYLLTKAFPRLDMLPSLRKCRGLIVENLENAFSEVSNPGMRILDAKELKVPELPEMAGTKEHDEQCTLAGDELPIDEVISEGETVEETKGEDDVKDTE